MSSNTESDYIIEAQRIAFAPFEFQATKTLIETGLLNFLYTNKWRNIKQITKHINLTKYGVTVLIEAGIAVKLILERNNEYSLSKLGIFFVSDKMTTLNFQFTDYVCYKGLEHLGESIRNGKPSGLKVFGKWATIYEALADLPNDTRRSWLNFDHFYSDQAFPEVLPIVFECNPKNILDVGGNTGKWTIECLRYSDTVKIVIADHEGQLKDAKSNLCKENLLDRADFYPTDLLKGGGLPKDFDIIWMSQFLCCFSEEEIQRILNMAKDSLGESSRLFILDTFLDKQNHPAAEYILRMTSLYFTCFANGNSKVYHSNTVKNCIKKAGLTIKKETNYIGLGHTLLECINAD
jgi:ubiquinone/menaquinone biosynthesis C-methylase UbiE